MSTEAGALHVTATGKFSLAEAKKTFLKMMRVVKRLKVGRVLFDARRVVGKPNVMERFYYGVFVADTAVDHALLGSCPFPRLAYVLKEPLLDPGHFGETVAMNRGGRRVKVFDNIEEARSWLDYVGNTQLWKRSPKRS